ncbi:MAG: dihydrofolate reductase family protein [Candidatus Acidiferrum sp.]
MQKLRVHCFGISLDGYGAGPNQSLDHPLGVGGTGLMEWFFPTPTFQRMHHRELANAPDQLFGQEGHDTGVDDGFAARSFEKIGAWIMGRNMFGPIRGPWANDDWKGWWGDNPLYHCDVFVLTHHARAPLTMEGGTTFHFVTDGIESALQQARAAAKDKDVRVGGGVATIRAYLQAGLVDELHLAQSPVLLGSGESLFTGLDLLSLGYRCVNHVPSSKTTHLVLARS